jgi:hypothetical protein
MTRFNTVFALLLLAVFLAVCLWQAPGLVRGKLTQEEIRRYLAKIEQGLPLPAAERPEVLAHVRAWAEADDGGPVYMLNLMRYYETLHPLPNAPPFAGSPRDANMLYEDRAMPLLFRKGGYALYAGQVQGKNILGFGSGLDDWSRVLVVRYPSRRTFFDLLTDPAYGPIEPYKLMALQVVLVPTSAELVIPDLRLAVGALLLLLFLATGWVRAARRTR